MVSPVGPGLPRPSRHRTTPRASPSTVWPLPILRARRLNRGTAAGARPRSHPDGKPENDHSHPMLCHTTLCRRLSRAGPAMTERRVD